MSTLRTITGMMKAVIDSARVTDVTKDARLRSMVRGNGEHIVVDAEGDQHKTAEGDSAHIRCEGSETVFSPAKTIYLTPSTPGRN